MSAVAYEAGLAAFREYFQEETAKFAGKNMRAGGRATKQYPGKEDDKWWLAEGPTMVHNYYNWRLQNPNLDIWHTPEGIPAIELDINVNLPGGITVKAFIDRVFEDKVTGQKIIVDLKTGKSAQSGLQLAVYRTILLEQFGEAPDYGAYWMARQGTLDTVHDLRTFPADMIQRWLRDVKKAIDGHIFVPNMSQGCDWCGVKKFCYAYGNVEFVPNFTDDLKENTNE